MSETQLTLFNKQPVTFAVVRLDRITPPEEGVKVSAKASVASLGFLSTVILRKPHLPEGRYTIVDGAGRYLAALADDLESIPAFLVDAGTPEAEVAAIRVSMNLARRPNAAHEAEALETLYHALRDSGMSSVDVPTYLTKTLGLSASVVKQRLKLLSLPDELRDGLTSGKVSRGVAGKIANLSPSLQERLVDVFREKGKLTDDDVKEVRRARQESAVASLPDALFEAPPEPTVDDRVEDVLGELSEHYGKREVVEALVKYLAMNSEEER